MSRSTLKLLPFLLLVLFSTNSCKKKNDQKSKTELLTQKNWYLKDLELRSGTSGTWGSIFGLVDDCDKDNFTKFNTNNKGIDDAGTLKCGSEPQTYQYDWFFLENETKISVDGEIASIEVLNETTFTVVQEDNSGTPSIFYRFTFRH